MTRSKLAREPEDANRTIHNDISKSAGGLGLSIRNTVEQLNAGNKGEINGALVSDGHDDVTRPA